MIHKRLIPICGLLLFIMGCPRKDEEAKISDLLSSSPYVISSDGLVFDDASKTPKSPEMNLFTAESVPFVRFVRWINRPVERHYEIDVSGDSAHVTMTANVTGKFYVLNTPGGDVYTRDIADSAYRAQIDLYKDNTGWHIARISPLQIYTYGAETPIKIKEVKAEVASRNYTFILTDPTNPLTKEELPTFLPNDTVIVTVKVEVTGDSCWVILHHGRYRKAPRIHHRDWFLKEGDSFTGTWYIADDSVVTPGVRYAAIDVMTWQTLWGDSTVTKATEMVWSLPYIVKEENEPLPPDTEE